MELLLFWREEIVYPKHAYPWDNVGIHKYLKVSHFVTLTRHGIFNPPPMCFSQRFSASIHRYLKVWNFVTKKTSDLNSGGGQRAHLFGTCQELLLLRIHPTHIYKVEEAPNREKIAENIFGTYLQSGRSTELWTKSSHSSKPRTLPVINGKDSHPNHNHWNCHFISIITLNLNV